MDMGADLRELMPDFTWNIVGFITTEKEILPVPPIPQVITGIFEEIVITKIEKPLKGKYECAIIRGGSRQYPELSLYNGKLGEEVIAIDVKTARRDKNDKSRTSRMTLGSYGGYFRTPELKKAGCVFPYGQYTQHWIIGFIYDWQPDKMSVEQIANVEVIIQEKWRIASRSTGTGDTAAIGAITEIRRLRAGQGDFSSEAEFLQYWRAKPVRRGG